MQTRRPLLARGFTSMARNEKGFVFIGFALLIAAVMMVVFNLALDKSTQVTKRFGDEQALLYTQTLSVRFGEQIRYAYDIAKLVAADPINNASLCPAAKGAAIINLASGPKLCLVKRKICVPHPHDNQPVCISTSDGSLLAKARDLPGERTQKSIALSWLLPQAKAQVDRPANPSPSDTSNSLSGAPVCLDGPCATTCGVNADCVSFKFCPRSGTCDAKQFVWQTVALIK